MKKKIVIISAVIVAAVATTGMVFAAFSNNITGAINVIGEAVSPSTCDNDGISWTLGDAVWDTVDAQWEVPTVDFSNVNIDCSGLTLNYVLLMADGSVIQNSNATILADTGQIAFSPRPSATMLEGFEVQYVIQ